MNLAIIWKAATPIFLGTIGLVGYMYVAIYQPWITKLHHAGNNIFIYTISNDVQNQESLDEISTKPKNYRCKFQNSEYECNVSKHESFDATTQYTDINKLSESSKDSLTKTSLNTKNNIYKIEINNSIEDWTKGNSNITIIPTAVKANNVNKSYALLTPIFALDYQYNINKYTKTEYFVVKTTAASTPQPTKYTCLLESKKISDPKEILDECTIYPFSNNSTGELKNLVFKKPDSSSENPALTTNTHYLVKLNTKANALNKHMHIKNNNNLVSLDDKIIPAIYHNEKQNNIFLLESITPKTTS